jgi:co-chaperonin GroES (HSP10)
MQCEADLDEPLTISPIRDWLYVERLREKESPGGIIFPETFKTGKGGFSAREKMNAVKDHFMVRVLATGPEVQRSEVSGLFQGDHALVWSYAAGDGSKLFTGESVGERDRLFIKPNDVVCAVDF